MLHGFGCDSRVFASIGTKLSKTYDVLMVDLPGHGQTKEEFRDFRFSAYTIIHALDQYLEEPYSLLGWSMGGQIALEMFGQKKEHKCDHAGCKHELFESMILISTTPKFVHSDDFPVGMNKAIFNKFRKGIETDAKAQLDDFYKLLFSAKEDGSKFIPGLKEQEPKQKTLVDCMSSFEKFDERKILPKINIPTLIITGDEDNVIDPKASYFMSQEIKGSSLKVFKGAGHAPHLTREKEMIDEIEKFLG